jgi:hypothetical protein
LHGRFRSFLEKEKDIFYTAFSSWSDISILILLFSLYIDVHIAFIIWNLGHYC